MTFLRNAIEIRAGPNTSIHIHSDNGLQTDFEIFRKKSNLMVANVSAFLSSDGFSLGKNLNYNIKKDFCMAKHLIDLSQTRLRQSFNKALKSQIKQTLHSMRVGLLPINTKQIGGLNIVQS